jgi:LPXTG-motif cell wall-anchored protein
MKSMVRRRVSAGVVIAGLVLGAVLVPQGAVADSVTGTISVGTGPFAEALSADGSRLYVGSLVGANSGAVSVVDTATGVWTGTIATSAPALTSLALSPDGSRLYTGHRGGQVRAIDTATGTVAASASAGTSVYGVAVSPDGSRLYTSNYNTGRVQVLNASTLTATGTTIPVGANPRLITISADGSRAYVANQGGTGLTGPGSVSVIDLVTDTVTATIPTGPDTVAVALSPDGTTLYASNLGDNTVSVIDVASNTVTGSIHVGNQPFQIAFTPDGTRAYVTAGADNAVSVIDTAARSVVSTIPVGALPAPIRISADGLTAYVGNENDATVSVIALDTFPAVTTTTLPDGTAGAAYTAAVAATGRPAPALSVTGGALPPGLTLDASGAITGTPTTAGTFTFTVTASSSVSGIPATSATTLTITIAPAPKAVLVAADDDFTSTPVPATGGAAGNVLANDTVDGSPVDPATVSVTLTDADGITGASIGADGILTIPAGAAAGTHTLTYQFCQLADPQNCATGDIQVRVLEAVVTPPVTTPTPTPTPTPTGTPAPSGSDPGATGAAGSLASTGSDIPVTIGVVALLLLAAGGGFLLLRRRRPTES